MTSDVRRLDDGDTLEVFNTFRGQARPADIREWETAGSVDFEYSLSECIFSNDNPKWIARVNGVPMMLFGVNPLGPPYGFAWMIATRGAEKHQHALHRHHRESMGEMLKVRPMLSAWADSRNVVHHKWMERMGWKPSEATIHLGDGAGVPFILYTYTKEMHDCASQVRLSRSQVRKQ